MREMSRSQVMGVVIMSCAGAMPAHKRVRPPMTLQRCPMAYMIQRQGRRRFSFFQLAHEKLRPLNVVIASTGPRWMVVGPPRLLPPIAELHGGEGNQCTACVGVVHPGNGS